MYSIFSCVEFSTLVCHLSELGIFIELEICIVTQILSLYI